MNIIALDASTSCVGMCLARNDQYRYSLHFVPKGRDAWAKIDDVSRWLQEWLTCLDLDCLVYEYPSGNRGNQDTTLKLGALMYACISTFRKHAQLPAQEIIVRPSAVKATGIYKGQISRASKYKVFGNIYKANGDLNKAAMARQDNEIDAIGVWLAGLKILKEQGNVDSDS